MKDQESLKRKERAGYLTLSYTFEESAKHNFDQKYIRAAIDLGYNSIELKVKALLLKALDELPGSHGGLISKFGEYYVITNKVSREIGHKLNQALSLRNKARYDPQVKLTTEDWELFLFLFAELSKFLK